MTLEARLIALVQAIGTDVKALFTRSPAAGGTTGQVWTKNSNADHDASWQTPAAGGGGASAEAIVALNSLGGF